MEQERIFFFKLLSIGSFNMQFDNSNNIQNKPMISLKCSDRKKWGNSYIVFNNIPMSIVKKVSDTRLLFAGKFDVDKNINAYLKLFKRINVPGKKPDYYIVTMITNTKTKIDADIDFIKADKDSNSRIFSSAYHQTEDCCKSETVFIVKHGDIVIINNDKLMFDDSLEQFLKIND